MRYYDETELYQVIGLNVRFYRKKANLTQEQLAERAQISISYLSKIEAINCRKSMSIFVLNHIANALDVDIRDFFIKR